MEAAYANQNKDVIINQLLNASIRLATTLETLFGGLPSSAASGNTGIASIRIATLEAADAAKHIDENVSVCGTVFGVKETGAVTYVNVGAAYPNNPLTLVVFAKDKGNIKLKLSSLDKRQICVKGVVKEYKGKAEIIITDGSQISYQ